MGTDVTQTNNNSNDNIIAALATIPFIGLIMLIAMKDASPLVKSHARQSNFHLVVALFNMTIGSILFLTIFLSCIPILLAFVDFIIWVIQVINALQSKEYKIPVVGDAFDGFMK
jgi:uncharacterized membrane protein